VTKVDSTQVPRNGLHSANSLKGRRKRRYLKNVLIFVVFQRKFDIVSSKGGLSKGELNREVFPWMIEECHAETEGLEGCNIFF
jgi:hypothetical protein